MGGSLRKPSYLDNDWFIVGITKGSYFTGTATPETGDEDIYNLFEGEYSLRRTDDYGNTQWTKGNEGKLKPIKLSEFNPDDMDFFLPKLD